MKCHINKEIRIGIPNTIRRQNAACSDKTSKRKAYSNDLDKHVVLEMKGSENKRSLS
jgi:predicted house-cleaning noncanonical NTP pyrophosphatase (MazG superfamily)